MSKTMEDLADAFAGESQARNKYMAYAKKAEEDGLPQIARLFRAVAQAEFIHAQNHFRAMEAIKSTAENLQAAINGENYEVESMYPPFIQAAETEGNKRAKKSFEYAWEVEKVHSKLYSDALAGLEQAQGDYLYYVCPVCGYTHAGSAPERCPVCGTPAARFEEIH